MEDYRLSIGQFSRVGQRYQNGENLRAAGSKNRNVKVLRQKNPDKYLSF